MNLLLPGKKALVTGATRGLGRNTTLALCEEGATVFAVGRNKSSLSSIVEDAKRTPGVVIPIIVDVTQPSADAEITSAINIHSEYLDIAINNAGVFGFGIVHETDLAEVRRIFEVNFFALYRMLRLEIKLMHPENGGSIVNVSSNMSCNLNVEGCSAYTASKAAVDALTRIAAKENARNNIAINSINPGPLSTDMTRLPGEDDASRDERWSNMIPVGRIGDVSEITEAIKWMISRNSRYLVGSRIVIDGAHSL